MEDAIVKSWDKMVDAIHKVAVIIYTPMNFILIYPILKMLEKVDGGR